MSIDFCICAGLLISTAGGRFPRAWLEPRANRMLVMKALRQDVAILAFHPHNALRALKAHAIPAGQGKLRQRYIARRKLVCIFEESPPSVPINEVVLRINER